MSYGTDVKTKLKAINFDNLIDSATIARIQEEAIEGNIKKSIEVGLSPVSGFGRFVGYSDPKKYPGDRKGSRPVNLYLSGAMLSYYKCAKASGQSVFIGILSDAPADVIDRAENNNFGYTKGVAARRFVPGPGETFKIGTMTIIRQILADRVIQVIAEE